MKANDIGLTVKELPDDLNAKPEVLYLLETIRGLAAQKLGLIGDYKRSAWDTSGIPKIIRPPTANR